MGSAFETVIAFPRECVGVEVELKTYQDKGDAGQAVYRRFCPNCGSGVVADAAVMRGLSLVLAGTLDDPNVFQPTMEVYCSSAQHWVAANGERTQFAKMPG